MSLEEEDKLNFYSKYNRVRGRQQINSLYALIGDPNASNSNLEIQIFNQSMLREERVRKSSLSPFVKYKKSSSKQIIPAQWQDKGSEQETKQNMEQINDKMQKLKRLEQQFHKQMERRQRQIKRKKQLREQQIRQRQKYKDNFINVVESKQQRTPSRKSSDPRSQKNSLKEPEIFVQAKLDFQDYYRDAPQVPICATYQTSSKVKKLLRQKLLIQRNQQQYVESVDEEADIKANSIVIDRINIANKDQLKRHEQRGQNKKQRGQNKNLYEFQLSHSRSQHIFPQYRSDQVNQKLFDQDKVKDIVIGNQYKDPQEEDVGYSPAKQLKALQNNIHLASLDKPEEKDQFWGLEQQPYHQQSPPNQLLHQGYKEYNQKSESQKQHQQQQNKDLSQRQSEHQFIGISDAEIIAIGKNKTGTQQGQQMRDQIQDKVQPIASRSEFSPQQGYLVGGPSVFYSQAIPKSKFHLSHEVDFVATESVDSNPVQSADAASTRQNKPQNKKSSFKRLIAENRSNLIPRMAISTILNQHINEALIDFKPIRAHPVHTPLHQSIISSEAATSSCKKRVNFKQRLVEQQLDKSHSREVKPSFHRDQAKAQKNRSLLLNFFAEN